MNEQEKRENVIKELECCVRYMGECEECPYDEGRGNCGCAKQLYADALALLKAQAQEPRVMAGAELTDTELIEKIRKAPIVLKPTVDAVPVVRCKDCRYWRQEVGPTVHWVCAQHSFDGRYMYTTPDFFCADGTRAEDEDWEDE